MQSKIKEIAYQKLSRRPYFSMELRKKLQELGFAQIEIDPVIAELERQGYLDDQQQTESFIARGIRKKKGPNWIAYHLKIKRGESVEVTYPKEVREASIREILNKKGKKGIASLLRKGFALDEILTIFNSITMLK